jgi:hypothetical protein
VGFVDSLVGLWLVGVFWGFPLWIAVWGSGLVSIAVA